MPKNSETCLINAGITDIIRQSHCDEWDYVYRIVSPTGEELSFDDIWDHHPELKEFAPLHEELWSRAEQWQDSLASSS